MLTYADVCCRFVVVEALRTHSGHPKALDLWRQRSRFREHWDKMVFVTAELHDDEATACANPAEANCKHWVRERYICVRILLYVCPHRRRFVSTASDTPLTRLVHASYTAGS